MSTSSYGTYFGEVCVDPQALGLTAGADRGARTQARAISLSLR